MCTYPSVILYILHTRAVYNVIKVLLLICGVLTPSQYFYSLQSVLLTQKCAVLIITSYKITKYTNIPLLIIFFYCVKQTGLWWKFFTHLFYCKGSVLCTPRIKSWKWSSSDPSLSHLCRLPLFHCLYFYVWCTKIKQQMYDAKKRNTFLICITFSFFQRTN